METLVLEQYLRVLYPEVRTWVKERNSSTAAEAATLAEAYIAARKGPGNYRYAGILHPGRGKSEGIGVGSNSHNTSQTKILKPIHNKISTAKAPPIGQHSNRADVVCFNCGEPGHTSPLCPLKEPKNTGLCWVPRPNHSSTYAHKPEPTITILLNGKPLTSLIDTGCSRTLVQSQYVPRDIWNEDETNRVTHSRCIYWDTQPALYDESGGS